MSIAAAWRSAILITLLPGKSFCNSGKNCHKGYELSRRDDLESLGYILIYLSSGSLPWENIILQEEICNRKKLLTSNIKIPGIYDIFISYLNYVKNLEFIETPDYEYIKKLFNI